jgi:hypothetical protein
MNRMIHARMRRGVWFEAASERVGVAAPPLRPVGDRRQTNVRRADLR